MHLQPNGQLFSCGGDGTVKCRQLSIRETIVNTKLPWIGFCVDQKNTSKWIFCQTLSRCFELGFILIKQLLWKGAVENKSSEWVLSQLRGSAAITRRNNPVMLQRKVLCFSGHCQGSKSKSHIIYNTRHICWKTPVMLRPSPPPPMLIHVSLICNRPFPSSPGSRYQNEVKCSAFDLEMILYSYANKTRFHKNGCALGLILKVRAFGTRKWPIKLESQHWGRREEVFSGKS